MTPVEKKMVIASDFHAARKAEDAVLHELHRLGYGEANLFAVKLALEEGLNNAIKHGNGCDTKKKVEMFFRADPKEVFISICDQGTGFDPHGVPDPTANENLEKPSGRGIMLMRAYMDEVRYSRRGCCVEMTKRNA